MRHGLPSAALLGLVLLASPRLSLAQGSAEQELLQLERDWCRAMIQRDVAFLTRILAEDYTGVGSRGGTETKAEALAGLTDRNSSVTDCVDSNVRVRVYGDAAVVTGLATRSGTFQGAPYQNRQILYTDTFVRRDGRWVCVASQGTLVAAQQG